MPIYKMPKGPEALRGAAIAEITGAVCSAQCLADLAGRATEDFVVRELLVALIVQLDRAAAAARRLSA